MVRLAMVFRLGLNLVPSSWLVSAARATPRRRMVSRSSLASLATIAILLAAAAAPAQDSSSAGYAWTLPASWRFIHQDRRHKVVLLAGSIGAFRDRPYGRLLHE